MSASCKNCEHVRKAYRVGYVACGYLSALKHGIEAIPKPIDDCSEYTNTFQEYFHCRTWFNNEKEIYEGWACLSSRPGQIKSNVLTTNCIILKENNCCNHYKKKENN